MTKTVVLYHRGCPDGFGSAYLVQRALDPDASLVPMDWHHEPPIEECRDAHVWSVDWLPDARHTNAIARVCETFTALDHHQSSLKETHLVDVGYHFHSEIADFLAVSDLGALNKVSIVIDQTHSGVGLTAKVMRHLTGVEQPWWVPFVEDRDLWRFDLDGAREVMAAIQSYPQTIEAWDGFAGIGWHFKFLAEGRAILRYQEQLIERTAASYVYVLLMRDNQWGFEVPCAVSPYLIGSDVAGLLAERDSEGIGAYAIFHPDHVQLGLRSRNDGPDVAVIAENYGGGGHKHASGLTMSYKAFFETVCSE